MNYANLIKGSYVGLDGGYKNGFWFSKTADIETWGRPIAVPVDNGDDVEVNTAHTWATGKGANEWDVKVHSAKITGAPVGDEGSQQFEWTAEVVVLGDNSAIQSMVQRMLNDDLVIWLKDSNCLVNDTYIQLGDDCVPVTMVPAFDSANTQTGQKFYTLQFKSRKKFFYNAVLDVTIGA